MIGLDAPEEWGVLDLHSSDMNVIVLGQFQYNAMISVWYKNWKKGLWLWLLVVSWINSTTQICSISWSIVERNNCFNSGDGLNTSPQPNIKYKYYNSLKPTCRCPLTLELWDFKLNNRVLRRRDQNPHSLLLCSIYVWTNKRRSTC